MLVAFAKVQVRVSNLKLPELSLTWTAKQQSKQFRNILIRNLRLDDIVLATNDAFRSNKKDVIAATTSSRVVACRYKPPECHMLCNL